MDVCVKTRTPDPFLLVHIKEGIEERCGSTWTLSGWRENEPFLEGGLGGGHLCLIVPLRWR